MEQYNTMSDGNINISDIIEVIQNTDPGSMATIAMDNERPRVKIIEQPASKALRFRYECEGRSAGSIPGVNSTPENKTFPSIRILGYKGRAMVVVSCVTKDVPYRPHPHNLVGKEVCKQGICTVEVPAGNMIVTFSNLGIQCVKKKDIEEALRMREALCVDPFQTGFEHKKQPTNIDLNAVRLCFQVFLEGSQKGKFNIPLSCIVSDPIYDKKAMSDLVICKLSHCSASVAGGLEMILLCEKVTKEDIQIRFFQEKDGQVLWEGYGDFQPAHVHKQTAIAFRTPSYHVQEVEQPVQVYIQLKRPSDSATSEPLPFQMLPLGTDDMGALRRKRQKFNSNPGSLIFKPHIAETEKRSRNQPFNLNIKTEPPGRISPFSGASAGVFNLQSVTKGSQNNMQILRPQVSPGLQVSPGPQPSPGRTPSPMEYKTTYSPAYVQQQQQQLSPQYQPNIQTNIQPIMQQTQRRMNVQLFPYAPNQSQLHQTGTNPFMVNRITQNNEDLKRIIENQGGELQLFATSNIDAAAIPDVTRLLDMDTQQMSIDWNPLDSADLADLGASLSENLSSGLCLTDNIEPTSSNTEETDHIKRIEQELSSLNKIFKPNEKYYDGRVG